MGLLRAEPNQEELEVRATREEVSASGGEAYTDEKGIVREDGSGAVYSDAVYEVVEEE